MSVLEDEIRTAVPSDIADIVELQCENSPARGGALSADFSANWFAATMTEMPVMLAVREGRVVGFLVSATFAAHADLPIVQALRRVYQGSGEAYLYGPICVAASERGRGIAGRLFAALRRELPGREGILFIRRDNAASLRAHVKMGMREVAEFDYDGVAHAVLSYIG